MDLFSGLGSDWSAQALWENITAVMGPYMPYVTFLVGLELGLSVLAWLFRLARRSWANPADRGSVLAGGLVGSLFRRVFAGRLRSATLGEARRWQREMGENALIARYRTHLQNTALVRRSGRGSAVRRLVRLPRRRGGGR